MSVDPQTADQQQQQQQSAPMEVGAEVVQTAVDSGVLGLLRQAPASPPVEATSAIADLGAAGEVASGAAEAGGGILGAIGDFFGSL